MRCDDVQPLLSDHLDGALSPAEEAGVVVHLTGCDACQAELVDLRAVVEMLRAVPGEAMPLGLFDRISAALAAEPERDGELGCEEARDLLSDRLENSLDADDAPHLATHLEACAPCTRAAAELAATIGLLRLVPREVLPADLPGRISAALALEAAVLAVAEPASRITCDEAEDYLTGHLEGTLDLWEGRAVAGHVTACPPCERKLVELSAVVGLLRQVPQEPMPSDLPQRVSLALAGWVDDLPVPHTVPALAEVVVFAPPARKPRSVSHWMSGAAGAVAACAMFMVWQLAPGAGVPRIETAAVSVKQDVAVNIGFDVDESVDGVIFQVDLPEGLKFIDDKAQPMLAQSVSWKGSLEKGKTVVPIVVRGIRPGRYEIEAFVRKGPLKRKTTIILPVEG